MRNLISLLFLLSFTSNFANSLSVYEFHENLNLMNRTIVEEFNENESFSKYEYCQKFLKKDIKLIVDSRNRIIEKLPSIFKTVKLDTWLIFNEELTYKLHDGKSYRLSVSIKLPYLDLCYQICNYNIYFGEYPFASDITEFDSYKFSSKNCSKYLNKNGIVKKSNFNQNGFIGYDIIIQSYCLGDKINYEYLVYNSD